MTGICMIIIPAIVSAQSNPVYLREVFLKDSLMDYSSEILVLNKFIHNSPKQTVAWWLRGKAKYHLQHYKGAMADGQQAIRLQLKTRKCTC